MNANQVFLETVQHLSQYNFDSLLEIAYTQYGIDTNGYVVELKNELIEQCALVEANAFSH